jgi:lipopolysaccharide transport system permease protein
MNRHSTTPHSMISSLWRNRELLHELVKRDFIGRYKGSMLGIVWSLFNPLLMLAIYTFVFSVAFKAKWGAGDESKVAFAIVLFSGMIVHGFFAECLNRAPSLITSNPNYVKKVVFPLEVLPWMVLFSAFLHFLISFCILLLFCIFAGVTIQPGAILLPLALLPLVLMTIGLSWGLAALGVYLRDLAQIIGMISTVLLFLAPIFYPIEALPPVYQSLLVWNPITLPIMQLRDLLLWGEPLQWGKWGISLLVSIFICYLGYWWFQKTRRGFADVL